MNSIFNFFALQLTYNVVLASTVLQTKSVIHTHTHTHTHICIHIFRILFPFRSFSSVQCSRSVVYDSLWHRATLSITTPGHPVHHQLPEFTQTHAHRVGDAIQPSHPLSPPSLPAPNPSQHHGLFQRVNSSHEVAKVLEFQLQHQSFQWTPRTYLL